MTERDLLAAIGGPRSRPPLALRIGLGAITLVVLLVCGALLLSDAAPDFLRANFGDQAQSLWDRIASSGRAGFITDRGRPEADLAVHVVMWFTLTLLISLCVWRWWGLAATAVAMAAFGVGIEIAQGLWSDGRAVERSDVEADLYGTGFGLVAAFTVMVVWALGAAIVTRSRGDDAPDGSTSGAEPRAPR